MVMGDIVNMLPAIVFSLVGVALIVLLIEVIKFVKVTRETVVNIKPNVEVTMQNVETLSTDIQPTLAKVDPMMDSLQLTVDAVNLEMMRVDQILEDVSEITEAASSATSAVDTITNAPVKAVTGVASKMRSKRTRLLMSRKPSRQMKRPRRLSKKCLSPISPNRLMTLRRAM